MVKTCKGLNEAVSIKEWFRKEDAEQLFHGKIPERILVSRPVWDKYFRRVGDYYEFFNEVMDAASVKSWNTMKCWDIFWMAGRFHGITPEIDGKVFGVEMTALGKGKKMKGHYLKITSVRGGWLISEYRKEN